MSHAKREYLREQIYLAAEKEARDNEVWAEWQEEMKQRQPAKIEVIREVKTSYELLENEGE